MTGKTGTTTRTVRNYLVILIDKPFQEELFYNPPNCFYVIVFISNIRVFYVKPESDSFRQIFPVFFVFPN